MDKTKELIMFLSLANGMMENSYLNLPIYMDEEVNDCLIKMYFVMMTGDGHPDNERLYNEFLLAYHSLNEKQQEIVKKDFISICEAQDRNQEQEKVKRKGEMKYE